jgi:protein-S-isoprenylcysteine O-methyltransferase Ste14
VLPWAISLLGSWYGWADGSPAVWNLLGLVQVAVGLMGLLWLTINGYAHYTQVPERVELNWEPKVLMTRGPYAYSRHPMYVTELALWLGWAVLYGSWIVLAGFVALWVVASILAPREERALEARFGEAYRRYRGHVPRWLGIPHLGSETGRTNRMQ